MKYKTNSYFSIDVGFEVNAEHVTAAIQQSNILLRDLPHVVYRTVDFKTISAIIGAFFCDELAFITEGIVNPIAKGYPDLIPKSGIHASEKELRRYPKGMEVKCTIGNVETGTNLKAGDSRIENITSITWQAHHREVQSLLGLVFDFIHDGGSFAYPHITGAFYSGDLCVEDWGKISGITGRNTKVTALNSSGKNKMGSGWIAVLDDRVYIKRYQSLLKFNYLYNEYFDGN